MKLFWFLVSYISLSLSIEHDFKGFDDSILFTINWPGAKLEADKIIERTNEEFTKNNEVMRVTSSNNEKYECYLPKLSNKQSTNVEDLDGPSPLQLLKPLFSQKICSYRLESFWSYEVCHGRYIRQYHDEREGKQVKTQEFFLGHWNIEKQKHLEELMERADDQQEKLKFTKIDGLKLPYVELEMGDGSMCDLSGNPRITRVRYVCYTHGKHEIYSFKETSTCEYEIIVLSPLLCAHPRYRPQDATENDINCIPVEDSPKKPRALLALEAESLKLQHQTVHLTNEGRDHAKDVVAVLKVEKIEKDGETHLKFEIHPLNEEPTNEAITETVSDETSEMKPEIPQQIKDKAAHVISDDSPARAFLNGETCLHGGSGWWRYEFCYGKYIEQYHIDRLGVKTKVNLGRFDEKAHLDWVKENKFKMQKPNEQKNLLTHFYSGGDLCDKTGKLRQTEVKLKCLENSSNTAQVSLYLLEPRTCHYILGVESPLVCDIIPLADDNGLVKVTKPFDTNDVLKTKHDKTNVQEDTTEKQPGNPFQDD